MPPTAPDPAHFRQVLGHFPTGVTVVAALDGDGARVGLAVGSFFSVSLEPPLIGFCAGRSSSSWPRIREAGRFCVSVLADDQEGVSRSFATKAPDKFEGLAHRPAPFSGAPVLEDALAWIDCELAAVHEAGDHEIALGLVKDLGVARESGPLVFFRGGYHGLGL
ncbi:MAG: flavin reductase family protein [Actinobacteria bacterium]|nr:flavin reductase family protein [Actinomycetota bacterium]